jgi:hypothetical protein
LRVGSSFQIRYFPPGSLSFEPLGTIVMMLLSAVTVKLKENERWHFPQEISLIESVIYEDRSVEDLWIKQLLLNLFVLFRLREYSQV